MHKRHAMKVLLTFSQTNCRPLPLCLAFLVFNVFFFLLAQMLQKSENFAKIFLICLENENERNLEAKTELSCVKLQTENTFSSFHLNVLSFSYKRTQKF